MSEEAKGDIFYGLHFYPGICQYQDGNAEPYRVYLDEDTLRAMDPTFAGCPVFVLHVDEVEPDLNALRSEADGWVSESFYNEADGKHWVKFVVVSTKGKDAIARGLKLSNCYLPKATGPGGTWNGIDYRNQITEAVYEHLAIVPNPRYEESVIMTPEKFKEYNANKVIELQKLKNNKDERKSMFSFFKRAKVENSADLETMSVELPKSKKEVKLAKLINDADEKEMKKEEPVIAQGHHLVDFNGKTMTVNDLVKAHKEMCDAMDEMKKEKPQDDDDDRKASEESRSDEEENEKEKMDPSEMNEESDDMETAKRKAVMSPDDEEDMAKEEGLREEEKKEVKDSKKNAKAEAKSKADKLRNANQDMTKYPDASKFQYSDEVLEIGSYEVERGKQLFGRTK